MRLGKLKNETWRHHCSWLNLNEIYDEFLNPAIKHVVIVSEYSKMSNLYMCLGQLQVFHHSPRLSYPTTQRLDWCYRGGLSRATNKSIFQANNWVDHERTTTKLILHLHLLNPFHLVVFLYGCFLME
jgi:hypothetical protein